MSVKILYVLKKNERWPFYSQNIAYPKKHLASVLTKALLVTHHAEGLAREASSEHAEIRNVGDILIVSGKLYNITKSHLVWTDVIYGPVCVKCPAVYLRIPDALKIHKPVMG